jgi:hypothetical protein
MKWMMLCVSRRHFKKNGRNHCSKTRARILHGSDSANCRGNNGKLLGLFVSEVGVDNVVVTLK